MSKPKFALLTWSKGHWRHENLSDGSLQQAINSALLYIFDNLDYTDMDFHIVEISKTHSFNTEEYKEFFEKKMNELIESDTRIREAHERKELARLKAKYEEKVVSKPGAAVEVREITLSEQDKKLLSIGDKKL